MTSIDVKIFEKNFIGLNDQKYAETYSPERIFAKNASLKNFPIVRLFWNLENFRCFQKGQIFTFDGNFKTLSRCLITSLECFYESPVPVR